MKRFAVAAAVLALCLAAFVSPGRPQDPPDVNKVSDFMQLKLGHSQQVLEGLALEDFGLIAKHSNEMALLSQEASWKVLQTEEYLQQSIEFRRTANALTRAAQEKNLDAAALSYVELTMKCVSCHKYVRDERMARFEPRGPLRPIEQVGQADAATR